MNVCLLRVGGEEPGRLGEHMDFFRSGVVGGVFPNHVGGGYREGHA